MDRVYGDFRPKGVKRDKDGWVVKGKRGSLIKFPKGDAEWANYSLLIILTILFLCQLPKDYIGINISILW